MKVKSLQIKFTTFLLLTLLFTASITAISLSTNTNEATNESKVYWTNLANNAWNYFQPGAGVIAETGLAGADIGFPYFTDWDAGFYLQAIMDAEKIGIINRTGIWGADDRIDKVLIFLEKRPLMPDGTPYLWYSAQNYQNFGNDPTVAADTGKLLVALKNLKNYDSSLTSRIDYIVYNRTNLEPKKIIADYLLDEMKSGVREPNIYDYYVTLGFAGFWPVRFSAKANGILDFILSLEEIQYNGIVLPKAKISCDPLLMCIFELEKNDDRLLDLTRQVYYAHEVKYNLTGKYVAFSEGSTGLSHISSAYEWVVMPDGRMWVVQYISQTDDEKNREVDMAPIIFLKAAVGLLAIYNTTFAQNMVNYLISQLPPPVKGYNQGVDENGRVLTDNNMGVSNGLIVTAARFAIEKIEKKSDPAPSPSAPSGVSDGSPAALNPSQNSNGDNSSPVTEPTLKPTAPTNSPSDPSFLPEDTPREGLPEEYYMIAASVITIISISVTGALLYKRKTRRNSIKSQS